MIGRSYYQFDKKIDLDRFNLTLFPGFETAINVYEGVLMMNVDLSHKVLFLLEFDSYPICSFDLGDQ